MRDSSSYDMYYHYNSPALPLPASGHAHEPEGLSSSDHDWHVPAPSPSRCDDREEKFLKLVAQLKLLLGVTPGPEDISAAIHLIEGVAPEAWRLILSISPESLIALRLAGSRINGMKNQPLPLRSKQQPHRRQNEPKD